MSKKPQPRSLSAEPLEERLPVSSSAAGVLLGFGFANDTTTAAYEAPQTTPTSVAQQPALVDLVLDLQLDALAVDLVHSEESFDTISSPSDDPFVLTPLTSGVALSDVMTDAHRELGDELLLFQISTLEVTPQRESARHDFGDAMTPPEDLTVYGYSPVANEIQKDDGDGGPQMSCGCGCNGGGSGCGCGTPYVQSACLTGGYTTACSAPWTAVGLNPYSGYYQYYHPDATMYMFQDGNDFATINATMTWVGVGIGIITVYAGGMIVAQDYSGSGVNSFSCDFEWEKPEGTPNDAVYRDFTFAFTVSGGNTVALNAHIGYVEVETRFAGYGGFKPVHVKNDPNKTDQTSANTVIVGQHVEAKFVHDPTFIPNMTNFTWFPPSGGLVVKDYITKNLNPGDVGYDAVNTSNNCLGKIITHDGGDLKKLQFDYYYINKSSDVGVIICTGFILTDPHGEMHFLNASASFYIEAATCGYYDYELASWSNNAPSTGIRKSINGDVETALSLGGIEKINGNEVKSPGISWEATVISPKYGAGVIALRQLVKPDTMLVFRDPNKPKWEIKPNAYVLDTSIIANKSPIPISDKDAVTIGNLPSHGGNDLHGANDSPCEGLDDQLEYVSVDESFRTYVVYKPNAATDKDSIWVTLAMMEWTWTAQAQYNNGWLGSGSVTGPTSLTGPIKHRPYHALPVWSENYENLKRPE